MNLILTIDGIKAYVTVHQDGNWYAVDVRDHDGCMWALDYDTYADAIDAAASYSGGWRHNGPVYHQVSEA